MNASCVPDGVSGYVVEQRPKRPARERDSAAKRTPTFFTRYEPKETVRVVEATRMTKKRARELQLARLARTQVPRVFRHSVRFGGSGLVDVEVESDKARLVLQAVAAVTGVPAGEIMLHQAKVRGRREASRARRLAAFLLGEYADLSTIQISAVIGCEHTTVYNAVAQFKAMLKGRDDARIPLHNGREAGAFDALQLAYDEIERRLIAAKYGATG